jgi:O-antigen/teichoic acid export membrane protein
VDKKKGFLNVSFSIISKIVLLFAVLYVRRQLIRYLGNDVNGLNSLYTDIIGMLSVAELGIGSAIVFSMYAPIVSGEVCRVSALYFLYKKLYRIIGIVIFAFGIVVIPFLPRFIKDYSDVSVNVYLTFFLTLVSVVISFFYSAKTSLIEAYKDNYITTGILFISRLIRYVLQIIAIVLWSSYTVYIICQIIDTLIVWLLTEYAVRKLHGEVIGLKEAVDDDTRREIIRNVKAMFMHKIGKVMVKTIDSLIISGFIGVVILGKYTNYNYIAVTMAGILGLFFTPLTSVIGHLCASGTESEKKKWFCHFYAFNYFLGVVFFLGFYAVIDYVVSFIFGLGLQMPRAIIFIITVNQFTQFMRHSLLLFRNASGTFYNDRWKPIVEGVVNLILSLVFVSVFPEQYRVVGVIAATIISTFIICNIVEPYVIYRHVFSESPKIFYVRNYSYTFLFIACLFVMDRFMVTEVDTIKGFFVNGSISVAISIVLLVFIAVVDKAFRNEVGTMIGKIAGVGRFKRG